MCIEKFLNKSKGYLLLLSFSFFLLSATFCNLHLHYRGRKNLIFNGINLCFGNQGNGTLGIIGVSFIGR